MPNDARPPGITADDLARWDAMAEEFLADNPTFRPPSPFSSFLERWRAGAWLGNELVRLGDDHETAEFGCFAMGQICAAWVMVGRDEPWAACRRVLDARASGRPLKPGPELATLLLRETTGFDSDPGDFPPWPPDC